MAQNKRTPSNIQQTKTSISLSPGPHLARIISHLDPSFMGAVKVTLLRHQGNTMGDENQSFVVRAAPPFFGNTAFEHMGSNATDFNDTQKSYGMWMIPPDVGVTVLVFFVDGDPSEGYWLGCVPPRFANHMVPGIAASPNYEMTPEDKDKYGSMKDPSGSTLPLPVAEVNRLLNKDRQTHLLDRVKKAVHPFADRLMVQGLLQDDVRGVHSSTARREVPSSVFGISTPGPLDKRLGAKKAKIGTIQNQTTEPVHVSRLGGTTIVMDDGNDQYQRKAHASELGQGNAYADILNGEKGDGTIPSSEYFRIRTRTGHQFLMHNSEDLIYITNSRGTAWIELSSNGKIDIYAEDSVSVHTKTDFNFRADRDVNIEAGRNINMKATAQWNDGKILEQENFYECGRIQIESAFNTNILIGANGKIETRTHTDEFDASSNGSLDIKVAGATRFSTGEDLDLNTTGQNAFTAGKETHINSGGKHIETAPQIHMNGPEATKAILADPVEDLPTHQVVETDGTLKWSETKYIKEEALETIMKRVPMHEPWALHENFAPELQSPASTDRELTGEE